MNRPRISLGFESTTVTLNVQIAQEIGRQLAEARSASSHSVGTIASRLLLSHGQIRALEQADPDVFYNAKFHAAALRKYAELLGVDSDQLDRVLIRPEPVTVEDPRETEAAFLRGRLAVSGRNLLASVPRPSVGVVVAAAVLVTVVAAALLLRSVLSNPAGPDADGPVEASALVDPSAPLARRLPVSAGQLPVNWSTLAVAQLSKPQLAESARSDGPSAGRQDPIGHVRVGTATWVFVRYRDNSTVERVLAPGQQMTLSDLPIYVAVGAADGAEVTIGDTPVDPTGFVEDDGELRIGRDHLLELTSSLQ